MRNRCTLCPCRNVEIADKLKKVREIIRTPRDEALQVHGLVREDYNLLMSSAIASLTGEARARVQRPREAFVRGLLHQMYQAGRLEDVEDRTHDAGHRFDFRVRTSGKRVVVVEVKGAEGNSVTLGDRPLGCDEFVVWCHLTGSLQKNPGAQARAIIGRLVKVMVNRTEQSKRYDVLVIWDELCGSEVRPCPGTGGGVVPCFFLFPQQQPTVATPHPPLHTLDTTDFPQMLFEQLGVPNELKALHVWQIEVELQRPGPQWMRQITYHHPQSSWSWQGRPQRCRPLEVPEDT